MSTIAVQPANMHTAKPEKYSGIVTGGIMVTGNKGLKLYKM